MEKMEIIRFINCATTQYGLIYLSSLIRTLPSAQESDLLGSCEFVGYTTGMEFHHSPKILSLFNTVVSKADHGV